MILSIRTDKRVDLGIGSADGGTPVYYTLKKYFSKISKEKAAHKILVKLTNTDGYDDLILSHNFCSQNNIILVNFFKTSCLSQCTWNIIN